MAEQKVDYKKVGFKSGIEIHQQLDTGKLFSHAPSFLRNDEPHYTIMRKLHKIAGETGQIDEAVAHEATLDKTFHYQGYKDTVSLVELDEEPPRPIDQDALKIGIQVALLLNCQIIPVTQVMRKTVIDGSNTSGFQRTVLIAQNGYVETSKGPVGVESVCLEEDAARIIKREKNKATYRLDRLGIPLIEIATAPDVKDAEHAKETALKLGEILRATKVKRGIGTIRQDVNVSIKGHDRVEIKGFQDPKMMIKTVHEEIKRQQTEIEKGKTTGEVRQALPSGKTKYLRPMPGKHRMYPETDLELLRIGKEQQDKIRKHLPKLRSEIKNALKKTGLSEEMIKLVLEGETEEYFALHKVYNHDANLLAKMITLWRTELATKTRKSPDEVRNTLSERVLEQILEKLINKKIEKADVKEIMTKILEGLPFEEATKVEKANDDELEHQIHKIIKSTPGLRPNAYMGMAMKHFAGKLDAKKAMQIINKVLG